MSILSVMDWVTANVNSSLSPRVNGTIQNGAVGVLNSAGFTSSNLVVFDYSAKVVDVAQSAAIFVECMENQSEQKTMGGADGYLFTNYLIDLIIVYHADFSQSDSTPTFASQRIADRKFYSLVNEVSELSRLMMYEYDEDNRLEAPIYTIFDPVSNKESSIVGILPMTDVQISKPVRREDVSSLKYVGMVSFIVKEQQIVKRSD